MAGGEVVDRGWDVWMASLTWWTWVWVSSGSELWATELNWTVSFTVNPLPCENLIISASQHTAGGTHKSPDYLVLFSRQVVSDSSRPHGLQHTRLPCPSPSPGVCPSSCPFIVPPAHLQGVLPVGEEVECPLSKQAWWAQILAKRCNMPSVNWADVTLN